MPIFVHLTSERAAQRIKRSGIRDIRGVYCLPVLSNYYVSHQWLRELKRGGQRVIAGVYFSLPDDEPVWIGHFGGPHEGMTAAQAAGRVMRAVDGLGLEVIVPRSITPGEIRSIRLLRHVIGWRYKPGAHGAEPCGCPRCQRGAIKSRKIRARYERWNDAYRKAPYLDLLTQLRAASDACRIDRTNDEADFTTCDILGEIRYRKAGSVGDIAFLIDHPNDDIVQCLAMTLGRYRDPATKGMLLVLCRHGSEDVRESAADSLLDLYGEEALNTLRPLLPDAAIARAIAEHG